MNSPTPLVVQLALGRILRMMRRPEEPGDVADYYACRSIIMDYRKDPDNPRWRSYSPNWVRDRNKGAAGD